MSEEVDVETEETFHVGDVVRLKNRILRAKEHRDIGPRILIRAGWPNFFYVHETKETTRGIPVIELYGACCRCLEKKNGEWVCAAHPMSYFERVRPTVPGEGRPEAGKRQKKSGDRNASIVTPLGEIASFEYRDDDADAGLTLNIFGRKFGANGLFIKKLVDLGKEKGIL